MSNVWLWKRLENEVARRVEAFPGVAGVCVRDLVRGDGFGVHAGEEFPTASTIKIHILAQLLARAERGEIDLERKVRLTPDLMVPGSGVIAYLEGDLELSVLNIAILMISTSDNTATNLCIDWAGMEETNGLLRELGLTRTVLRRKMQDFDAVRRNDENVSTPTECVAMLEHLHNGRPTPWVAERCLSIMKKWKKAPLNQAVPATIAVANKPGGMERVRCDAGIVYLPRRPYAIAVMTKFGLQEPADQERFIVETARLVHETMVALDTTNDAGLGLPR